MAGGDNQTITATIREELARRRLSRASLAVQAKISLSSLEKALSGQRPFTEQALVRIEAALGCRQRGAEAHHLAPAALGSYARPAVSWLEGDYLTLRPSASDPAVLYAYRTQIAWDSASGHLTFTERDRLDSDFTQQGDVSIPHQSGHIYLVTNRHGQFRLGILARPTIDGDMHGLLATLQAGRGSHLTPIAMPIVLVAMKGLKAPPATGRIAPDHAQYTDYAARLRRTLDDSFAALLGQAGLVAAT